MKEYQLGQVSTPSGRIYGLETHFVKNMKSGKMFEARKIVKSNKNNMIGRRLIMGTVLDFFTKGINFDALTIVGRLTKFGILMKFSASTNFSALTKFVALIEPVKDELRILRSLNGGSFQKLVDFINTEDSVLLIIEKVTPHPNDNYVTSTLYDVIKTEANRQSKLQVGPI